MDKKDVKKLWKVDLEKSKADNSNALLINIRQARWDIMCAGENWLEVLDSTTVQQLIDTDMRLQLSSPPVILRDASRLFGLPGKSLFLRGTEFVGARIVLFLVEESRSPSFRVDGFFLEDNVTELLPRFPPPDRAAQYTPDASVTGLVERVAQAADRIGLADTICCKFPRFL